MADFRDQPPDLYGFYDLPGFYHHFACGFFPSRTVIRK